MLKKKKRKRKEREKKNKSGEEVVKDGRQTSGKRWRTGGVDEKREEEAKE